MRGRRRRFGPLTGWARRWWGLVVLVGVVLIVAYLARDIPNYPADRASNYRTMPAVATALATVEPKDRLTAEQALLQYQTDNEIKIWTTIVQAVGGRLVLVGIWFTWRNLRVAQEGQITNRFSQAISQLGAEINEGKPNLEVRLGGIYALERIARDSPRDHWTIMEVLTAYVRENAGGLIILAALRPYLREDTGGATIPAGISPDMSTNPTPPPLRTDIQAILTVLGRRVLSNDPRDQTGKPLRLDLQMTNLGLADLKGAHLERVNLAGTYLRRANFSNAHLQRANLQFADLESAVLLGADLKGAMLWGATLTSAALTDARPETTDAIMQRHINFDAEGDHF